MRLADMEAHHEQYGALEARIRGMVETHEFPDVFSVCLDSFEHIVPAIKFRKQKGIQPNMPPLLSFSVICKYAPPLFEHGALERLLQFVKATRMLANHESGYPETIERALECEEIARTIWNHIDQQQAALQRDLGRNLGVNQDAARELVEVWEKLGIISRDYEQHTYPLYFCSRLDSETEGICPSCGVRGKGRKELFLRPISCKRCGWEGYYHISYPVPIQK